MESTSVDPRVERRRKAKRESKRRWRQNYPEKLKAQKKRGNEARRRRMEIARMAACKFTVETAIIRMASEEKMSDAMIATRSKRNLTFVVGVIQRAIRDGVAILPNSDRVAQWQRVSREQSNIYTSNEAPEEQPLLSSAAMAYFEKHGRARKLTMEEACALVLSTVHRDDLIGAILDDGVEV